MFHTAQGAALSVAVDGARNVYVSGSVVGDLVVGGQTVYGIGNRDSFVASFTETGALRWVKRLGGANTYSDAYGIAVDAEANVYVVGGGGSIDLGGGMQSGIGTFMVSYTSDGTWRWARGDGSVGGDGWFGVATAGGRVFAIGQFLSSLSIEPLAALQGAGAQDVVIASFDAATGAAQWDRAIGTAGTDYGGSIVAHDTWLAFPVSEGGTNHLVSYRAAGANRDDITLLANLDQRGLTVDSHGNLYQAGLHTGGTDTINGAPYESGANPFVHSYDATLASRWSYTLSVAPAVQVTAIPYTSPAIDSNGALVVAGTFDGTIYAGGPALTLGNEHIFIAHFGADGTPGVARKLDDGTSAAYEWVQDSVVDNAGAIYVAGQYFGTPNFGAGAMTYAPEGGPLLLKLAP